MNQIYLIRHGENKANVNKEFSYKLIDYPLNEKGRLQAQQSATALQDKNIHAIYTSPLKRAYQTAEIIGNTMNLKPIVIEAFRELNIGDLEKKPPTSENWAAFGNVIQSWINGDKDASFPNGENYHQLWSRYERGLIEAVRAHPDQNLLIAGHGGLFTLTLPDLCPGIQPEDLHQMISHNASLSKIDLVFQDGRLVGTLVDWGRIDHLSGWAAELVPAGPQ